MSRGLAEKWVEMFLDFFSGNYNGKLFDQMKKPEKCREILHYYQNVDVNVKKKEASSKYLQELFDDLNLTEKTVILNSWDTTIMELNIEEYNKAWEECTTAWLNQYGGVKAILYFNPKDGRSFEQNLINTFTCWLGKLLVIKIRSNKNEPLETHAHSKTTMSSQENMNRDVNNIVSKKSYIGKDETNFPVKTENIDARAKEEFIKSCRDFYGSYESLYRICNSDLKDSLKLKYLQKWERLIKINNLSALNVVWEKTIRDCSGDKIGSLTNVSVDSIKLDEVAGRWLKKLEEWGVERKEEEGFIIDVNSTSYYDIDNMYKFGVEARVIEKCWVLSKDAQGNKLEEPITVEKGLAKVSGNEEER